MSTEEAIQSSEDNEVLENESINSDESSNEGADLSPAQEPEKIVYSDAQQENINQMFGKKTKQLRDTERERDVHLKTIEELKSKIPTPATPSIPDLPDKYDYDSDQEYFNAVAERDKQIRASVQFESQQLASQEQERVTQQNALMESQRQNQEASNKLVERAGKNGITQDDIQKAAVVVGQYQMNDGIVSALLNDSDGDVMIMHLANNPIEADNLSRMNPFEAARMLDTSIREKAQKYKLSSSNTPNPSTEIKGKGGGEVLDPIIAGATFE